MTIPTQMDPYGNLDKEMLTHPWIFLGGALFSNKLKFGQLYLSHSERIDVHQLSTYHEIIQ